MLKSKKTNRQVPESRLTPNDHLDELVKQLQDNKIEWERTTLSLYEQALKRENSWGSRVKAFLLAENQSGRWAKVLKDLVLFFTPYKQQVDTISEFVKLVINEKQQEPQMKGTLERIKRKLKQKSTKAGAIILVAILSYFGIQLEAVELVEAAENIIIAVIAVVVSVTALWEMIREEKGD